MRMLVMGILAVGMVIGLYLAAKYILGVSAEVVIFNNLDRQSFVACGCGCCGGQEKSKWVGECVYSRTKFQSLMDEDKKVANSKRCPLVGCSGG